MPCFSIISELKSKSHNFLKTKKSSQKYQKKCLVGGFLSLKKLKLCHTLIVNCYFVILLTNKIAIIHQLIFSFKKIIGKLEIINTEFVLEAIIVNDYYYQIRIFA